MADSSQYIHIGSESPLDQYQVLARKHLYLARTKSKVRILTTNNYGFFVVRNFADRGARAPMKKKGEASYKSSENPHLLHGFLEFVVDLWLKPATLKDAPETVDRIRHLRNDGKSEPWPNHNRRRGSKREMIDKRRCGVT